MELSKTNRTKATRAVKRLTPDFIEGYEEGQRWTRDEFDSLMADASYDLARDYRITKVVEFDHTNGAAFDNWMEWRVTVEQGTEAILVEKYPDAIIEEEQ